jgi:hypothetical protein
VGSYNEWGGSDAPIQPVGVVTSGNSGSGIGGGVNPQSPMGNPVAGSRGSVLCLRPGYDLGLEPSIAPSMNGLYNFAINVQWWNPSFGWTQKALDPAKVDQSFVSPFVDEASPNALYNTVYALYIVTITSGLVTIKDNGTVTQTGLLTRADVLRAQSAPALDAGETQKLVGGDFFNKMKQFLGRGGRSMYGAGAQMAQRLLGGAEGPQAAPAPAPAPPSPAPVEYDERDYSVSSAGYGWGSGARKRKEMCSPFEDPRERALAPHLRGRGVDPMMPVSPPREALDPYDDEPDDKYVREPPYRDHRSPEERYDSAMPDIPPERISRRREGSGRPPSLEDMDWEGPDRYDGPTPSGPHPMSTRSRHVFRS